FRRLLGFSRRFLVAGQRDQRCQREQAEGEYSRSSEPHSVHLHGCVGGPGCVLCSPERLPAGDRSYPHHRRGRSASSTTRLCGTITEREKGARSIPISVGRTGPVTRWKTVAPLSKIGA